jgi:hypothetical protein
VGYRRNDDVAQPNTIFNNRYDPRPLGDEPFVVIAGHNHRIVSDSLTEQTTDRANNEIVQMPSIRPNNDTTLKRGSERVALEPLPQPPPPPVHQFIQQAVGDAGQPCTTQRRKYSQTESSPRIRDSFRAVSRCQCLRNVQRPSPTL